MSGRGRRRRTTLEERHGPLASGYRPHSPLDEEILPHNPTSREIEDLGNQLRNEFQNQLRDVVTDIREVIRQEREEERRTARNDIFNLFRNLPGNFATVNISETLQNPTPGNQAIPVVVDVHQNPEQQIPGNVTGANDGNAPVNPQQQTPGNPTAPVAQEDPLNPQQHRSGNPTAPIIPDIPSDPQREHPQNPAALNIHGVPQNHQQQSPRLHSLPLNNPENLLNPQQHLFGDLPHLNVPGVNPSRSSNVVQPAVIPSTLPQHPPMFSTGSQLRASTQSNTSQSVPAAPGMTRQPASETPILPGQSQSIPGQFQYPPWIQVPPYPPPRNSTDNTQNYLPFNSSAFINCNVDANANANPSVHVNHSDSTTENKISQIKPDTYDGSELWSHYYLQFEIASSHNQWSEKTKASQLLTRLRGKARLILSKISDQDKSDYKRITKILAEKFDEKHLSRMYYNELQSRKQKKGESYVTYSEEIDRLSRLAYSSSSEEERDRAACRAFIDGINNPQMEFTLKSEDIENFQRAVERASILLPIVEHHVESHSRKL